MNNKKSTELIKAKVTITSRATANISVLNISQRFRNTVRWKMFEAQNYLFLNYAPHGPVTVRTILMLTLPVCPNPNK